MKKPRNVRTFFKKVHYHNLLMQRCGLPDSAWKKDMRFCSHHSTENVRLRKKVNVCGTVEDIVFEYRNIPNGSGIQTEKKSLNVFYKRAVRYWQRKEEELSEQHGSHQAKN